MKETATNSEHILGASEWSAITPRHLFDTRVTQQLETAEAMRLDNHVLMQRAGLAIAQLAIAVAPHAQCIWVVCGSGNNGGDGYEAAMHLKLWGKSPVVTCLGELSRLPADALASRQRALHAGVCFADTPPDNYDLCIDAIFGTGARRPLDSQFTSWISRMNSGAAPTLAVDVPSGLDANTGATTDAHIKANFTLCLLTLKPGLFTADGRAVCGEIWFNSLNVAQPDNAIALLNSTPKPMLRAHNTHKGSFGDICIIGGSKGMIGAALLAARAALHGGAGRVYVGLLDELQATLDAFQPAVMFRPIDKLSYESMVVVAGCGGGDKIVPQLPDILTRSKRLLLDADAINAIACDPVLKDLLSNRPALSTVITPHPLEAARLMNLSTATVQANRLQVAQAMADRFACTTVLKGSGSIIAAPNNLPRINPTGSARLATAGTGDVLSGLIGASIAAGAEVFQSTCESVFRHGQIADSWGHRSTMTATDLSQSL